MSFSDNRKKRKFLKIRREVLEKRKLLSYEEAISYTNNELFQDCHIIPETKEGFITGHYYLISEEMAKKQIGRG